MDQGEIWLVNLSPTVGAEITKTRPCVIISSNEIGILPLKVIAPITDYKPRYDSVPWMVELPPDGLSNLSKRSVVDLFQLRSVSQMRLIRNIGKVADVEFQKILDAIKIVFGIY
ncbi:MAG: type II toxin-antitoxin system PemK/MazF family toxin [Candidatus Thermoplasmatota archaeon]|nr:type II toxin-antitoxin system PemK/MazF family toxin [Candidatus Thermoplasmatota archaeon]